MKTISVLKTLSLVTFAIGISATPVAAQHCNVKSGDTMWHIAKRYKVNFQDVLDLNRHFKDCDVIFPQDKVELPDGSTGHSTNESSHKDDIKEGNETTDDRKESSMALEVLNLVNVERKKQGLNPLILSHTLNGIANEKAKDMAVKNYFSHQSPTYGSPFEMLQRFGVTYSSAGENIAGGQKTAQAVMTDWMNSSGHRANILNKNYTELGVGYYQDGSYGTYWVQLFIKK